MRALILTYHSHHVLGPYYGQNDHRALAHDLLRLTQAGFRIVPLLQLSRELIAIQAGGFDSNTLQVAITFDDGPVFDVAPFSHPTLGHCAGFLPIMRSFAARSESQEQPQLHATSFVIADPGARAWMDSTFDAEYTYLRPGAMRDTWWNAAIDTGLIGIANHSWDHLHPGLAHVAHSIDARGDFTQVCTPADADLQISRAHAWINARTNGRATPLFAFPFGHHNAFLTETYLPTQPDCIAAFTVVPKPLNADADRYALPRFVCGAHWHTAEQFDGVLESVFVG